MSNFINNEESARQLVIFSDMGVIMTDIDGYRDVNGKGYIFTEVKGGGANVPSGQRRAFKRLLKSCGQDKPSMFIVVEHSEEFGGDINLAKCRVRSLNVVVPHLGYVETWTAEEYDLGEFTTNCAFAGFHYVLGQPYNSKFPVDVEYLMESLDSPFVCLDSFNALLG